MSCDMLGAIPVLVSAAVLLGLAFGLLYFLALQRTAALLAAGDGWLRPAGLTLVRLLGATLVLTLLARFGAVPLLAGFLGFLLARMIALRSLGRLG